MLCIDFDGTIVERDISSQLLERYGKPGWQEFRQEYLAGRMTVEQYSQAAIDLLEGSAEEIAAYAVEIAEPRDGFLELLDFAQWFDWIPVVLSSGWDLYIDPILDKIGADRVTRHTGRARFAYRWRVRYLSPRGIELADSFKLSYVASYIEQGDFVTYVGDGPSDIAPAKMAHAVFGRGALLEALEGTHDRVFPYETFHDIVSILHRDGDAWLRSFSSTTAGAD